MKTNQRVQLLGLVLCTASTVNAQSEPPPASVPPPPVVGPQSFEQPAPRDYVEMSPARGPSTYAGRYMLGINWDVAVPVGSVQNFTGNASPVGFELLFQYWVLSRLTVGAGMDWQTYWDAAPRSTYPVQNGAITATADNSVQNGAARFIARFYAIDKGPVLPYAGVNVGLGWSTFQSHAADLALYDNTLSFLLGGELGVLLVAAPDVPIFTAGARYTNLPAADFLAVTNVQSFTFQFGMMSP